MKTYLDDKNKELFEAILSCNTAEEIANFCRDLMTKDEINEFVKRYKIASKLNNGESQRKVSKELNVSITTVTRVNKWLQRGMNGYKTVLNNLPHHHKPQSIGL
ncbi:MAG: YerC/YecD family TrpR-related protein [Candidatus Dojkabacteria bacterium]